VIQGPLGIGKTSVLTKLICIVSKKGERMLVTTRSNVVVDNMVERLVDMGLNIVQVGNHVRMSPAIASKSLGSIVKNGLISLI
jgi:superfamily II DNA or RNA helicase